MNKDRLFAILKIAAAVFIILFLCGQLYSTVINPFTTETVYSYDTYAGIETEGYIIRDEIVLTDDTQGFKSFSISNGDKVAKNGVIAEVYDSKDDVENIYKLTTLNKRINNLEDMSGNNNTKAANLDLIDSKIKDYFISYLANSQCGEISDESRNAGNGFLEYTNRRKIATGEISDFNELISALKSEAALLESSIGSPHGSIISEQSGYYFMNVDGYEGAISVDDLSTLDADTLTAVKPSDTSAANVVGKIVPDFSWYIAAKVPFNDSLKLKQSGKVTVKTGVASAPEISATVKYINKQSVGDEAVVVLECDKMNSSFADIRFLNCTIVLESYSGLKVTNSAIRIVDGVRGVYTVYAGQAKFVEVNIIYSNDIYTLCQPNYGTERKLKLYDEVITKGKNLYDGKVVQ